MIVERPVIDLLTLEIESDGGWVPWTGPLHQLSIHRGGKRDGLTQSVDIGTLSADFINAGDPLVNARTVPAANVYSEGFTSGPGGWEGGTWNDEDDITTLDTTTGDPARLTFDGLVPGRAYIVRAWRAGAPSEIAVRETATYAEHASEFSTYGAAQTAGAGKTYDEFEKTFAASLIPGEPEASPGFEPQLATFTAVWPEHDIEIRTTDTGTTRWDRVQIIRDAYEVATPELRPNQRLRIRSGEVTLWAGTTEDVAAAYDLDKNTGETTATVSVSAVDAVSAVATVTRYGAVVEGGAGSETWPARINRLALSVPAGIAVEHVDEADLIVRYSI